ncbi:unnamed protein product [Thlaspi arvense]|uniref:Uncharacterized protein n=1 Tax=Thlaspi arvense TaxID=13288 RepID=A0AAU9S4E7_THLAR|nr:unnamed protein product [Thlaspi arvense]
MEVSERDRRWDAERNGSHKRLWEKEFIKSHILIMGKSIKFQGQHETTYEAIKEMAKRNNKNKI